jgi:hypothetical protein
MTTAAALIVAAALALLGIVAGEAADLPFRRRMADAGRWRLPAPAQRARLRR